MCSYYVIGRALQRAAQKNNSGTQGVNGTLRKATEPKKGKKAKTPRTINKHEKISLVTWNMAQPSKTQIQLLDFMEHDIVFLPEIWDKGQELLGYSRVACR